MRKIRDVLRYRHSTDLSLEAISRSLNISKGVVAKYVRLAADAGLTWPLPADLDDGALERQLYRQPSARESTFTEPDYALIHQELKRRHGPLQGRSLRNQRGRLGVRRRCWRSRLCSGPRRRRSRVSQCGARCHSQGCRAEPFRSNSTSCCSDAPRVGWRKLLPPGSNDEI